MWINILEQAVAKTEYSESLQSANNTHAIKATSWSLSQPGVTGSQSRATPNDAVKTSSFVTYLTKQDCARSWRTIVSSKRYKSDTIFGTLRNLYCAYGRYSEKKTAVFGVLYHLLKGKVDAGLSVRLLELSGFTKLWEPHQRDKAPLSWLLNQYLTPDQVSQIFRLLAQM